MFGQLKELRSFAYVSSVPAAARYAALSAGKVKKITHDYDDRWSRRRVGRCESLLCWSYRFEKTRISRASPREIANRAIFAAYRATNHFDVWPLLFSVETYESDESGDPGRRGVESAQAPGVGWIFINFKDHSISLSLFSPSPSLSLSLFLRSLAHLEEKKYRAGSHSDEGGKKERFEDRSWLRCLTRRIPQSSGTLTLGSPISSDSAPTYTYSYIWYTESRSAK